MAKKIKFPLKMKNGALVRTIEELRENFDIDSLLEQFENGKLVEWLEDRYYDVEAEKIRELDRNSMNFAQSLCKCLGIEVQNEILSDVDMDFLKRRVEKLEFLKSRTADEVILSKVDDIAITQEDLGDLIDSGKHTIYLFEGDFTIPVSVPNMTYIGIYEPCAVVRAKDNVNFKRQNITFEDMPFIWDVSGVSMLDRTYQAEQLFLSGQYREALVLCRKLVEEDNPRAIMLLYQIAEYFICDSREAQECLDKGEKLNDVYSLIEKGEWDFIDRYRKALKKNAQVGTAFDKFYYSSALYNLGRYGDDDFDNEMIDFLQEAVSQNLAIAVEKLGEWYYSGVGVSQNYAKSLEWFQKAAIQNHANAKNSIGFIYYGGQGVTQNYQEAVKWTRQAAEQNYAMAQNNMGELYRDGEGVAQNYQEAMNWFQKAAAQNYTKSQRYIGDLYYKGLGVNVDYKKAMEWYMKAAGQNMPLDLYNVGWMYQNGYGVVRSYQKAIEWYLKAADQDYSWAMNQIGWMYQDGGYGVNQNDQKAFEWYLKAANLNNAGSQMNTGWMYENGRGVKQDYRKAMEWYRKSADQGDADGMNGVGWLYEKGYGVPRDYQKAREWYRKAAEGGSAEAKAGLQRLG